MWEPQPQAERGTGCGKGWVSPPCLGESESPAHEFSFALRTSHSFFSPLGGLAKAHSIGFHIDWGQPGRN